MTALTIGVFDGVHRGHQHLLQQLKKKHDRSIVLTFSNHPSEILKQPAPPQLTPSAIKRLLIEEEKIDEIISIPFTRSIADQSFEEFLEPYTFTHLVLGEGAALGKDCLGTPDALRILGLKRGFTVQVLPKLCIGPSPVSSSRIRRLIAAGDLNDAESLLGRPYFFYYSPEGIAKLASWSKFGDRKAGSIFREVTISEDGIGTSRKIESGEARTNFDPNWSFAISSPDNPEKPFLPPDGEYSVWSHSSSGIIPTTLIIQNQQPILPLNVLQLISFGPNLNPKLLQKLCLISPVAS
jgi:cytidyltransferase-like protein